MHALDRGRQTGVGFEQELIRVTNHPYVTAETVCELLRKIAELGLGMPTTLVLDNARDPRCERVQSLARELQIELLFLPSYSPNLNLIERLGKFTKKEALGVVFPASVDVFLDSWIAHLLAEQVE